MMQPLATDPREIRHTMNEDPGAIIDPVIARMDAIEAELSRPGERDGVIYFNQMYREVTRKIRAKASDPTFFAHPEVIAQLDVIFAGLYFTAYDTVTAGEKPAEAWQVVFAKRADPNVLAVQFAVAGMNAHINHDLALALLHQWTGAPERPSRDSDIYSDYTKVNEILQSEIGYCKQYLEPGELKDFDTGELARLDSKIAMLLIDKARAHAWLTADGLWDARASNFAEKLMIEALDRLSGQMGQALLTPL
jgi:hypothetical protein